MQLDKLPASAGKRHVKRRGAYEEPKPAPDARLLQAARDAVRMAVCGPVSRAKRLAAAVLAQPGGEEALRLARYGLTYGGES